MISLLLMPTISMAQGCMGGGDKDGVQVVGYIQPQYEYQFLGDGVEPMHGLKSNNSFYFNRARIGVVGNIPYDFSYYVLAELSPSKSGPYILDAFVTNNMAKIKKPVAPIVWAVQFMSPPSEIVAVEIHKNMHDKIESLPNEFNDFSGAPRI